MVESFVKYWPKDVQLHVYWQEQEPEIFDAIKKGAILENIIMDSDGEVDFSDTSITQNTRVSYPIHHIDNIK